MASGNLTIFNLEGDKMVCQNQSAKTTDNNHGLQTTSIGMEGNKQISLSKAAKGDYSLGNLQTGVGSKSSEDTYQLEGKDASLACYFFETELSDMCSESGCNTVRMPAFGIANNVTIKCVEPFERKKMEKCFEKLKLKIQSLSSQEVYFSEDKSETVERFIKENISKDVFLYINRQNAPAVLITTKDSTKLNSVCHKLKVELGIITPTGQRDRKFYTESEELMSDKRKLGGGSNRDIPSSGIYPDLSSIKYSDINFDFKLNDNLLVKVYKYSITCVRVDAIVNAANESMQHAGGVARVIEEAAGKELTVESRNYIRQHGELKVGEVCLTSAGKLRYKSVIHAVGPQWQDYHDKPKCLEDLCRTVYAVLRKADEQKYEKIAMPAISAGIFGVPKELCTAMYLRAAIKYSEECIKYQTSLREFHIVDVNTEILKDIRVSWEKWQNEPQSTDPWRAINEYTKKRGNLYQSHQPGKGSRDRSQWATSSFSENNIDFDVTFQGHTLRFVDMGKEDRYGCTMQVFQLGQNLSIKIYKGSLVNTLEHFDALITSINTKGEKGQLAKHVADAGGNIYCMSFDEEKRKKYSWKAGDIFKCKSGHILVRFIINVVIDRYHEMKESELTYYQFLIKTFLRNVNDLEDVKTMVMPLIGSGGLKVPSNDLDRCCSGFVQAVLNFCFEQKEPNINEIHIVDINENVCESLKKAFHKMSVKSSSEISDVRRKLNTSSSRGGAEGGMRTYNAGSSSENRSRSPTGSSTYRYSPNHPNELATSSIKDNKNNSVTNVTGSGLKNYGDQDKQVSNDEHSDDQDDGNATSRSNLNPPDKKSGNVPLIFS